MFSVISVSGLGVDLSSLATDISTLETLGGADVSVLPNNESCYMSIVHPFLYKGTQGNETDKKLSAGSAGRLIANKLLALTPDACFTLMVSCESYEKLKTELEALYALLFLPELQGLVGMCDFMGDIENQKKLGSPAASWPLHKVNNNHQVSGFDLLTGVKGLVDDFEPVASDDLSAFESEVNDYLTEVSASLNTLDSTNTTFENSQGLFLQGANQHSDLISACDALPQEQPYCVALCFMGSVDSLNVYRNLFGV